MLMTDHCKPPTHLQGCNMPDTLRALAADDDPNACKTVKSALDLLEEFSSTGWESMGEIERSVENRDAASAAKAAHSLKGAAGILCAESLRARAAEMEAAGRARDEAALVDLVPKFADETDRCLNGLAAAREALQNA